MAKSRTDILWKLMYFVYFCLQTKREGEKEPLQPFSHQVRLPWKHQSPEKDKYNTEQVRHDPLTSHPATSTSDKWNSFLSRVSRTLHGSLVTHRNMASLWKQQTFLVPLQVEIWPHLFMLILYLNLCSILPETALQWSDSFEDLLKHPG